MYKKLTLTLTQGQHQALAAAVALACAEWEDEPYVRGDLLALNNAWDRIQNAWYEDEESR